ncbi:MAG: hypothetical protein CML17_10635 [Pusillimonas sp.]|jgi:hypothetical protein|nr:hypothetical protein [Pusillimonas sp.]
MPNLKLTELETLSGISFTSNDLLYIVDEDTNSSKKITFNTLAGASITSLSAYNQQNTSNVLFLSAAIDINTSNISNEGLELDNLENRVNTISGVVDDNTTKILAVSTLAENNTNAGITTDILEVSGQVVELSANFLAIEDNDGIQTTIQSTTANVDFLSGSIDTNTTSTNHNTLHIANIRTLSGFSGTVTTASVTQTKHVPIVIGSTTYKLLLAD